MPRDPYTKLHALSKRIARFQSISSLLEWDQETYLPQKAISARAEQLEEMSGLIHKLKTAPSYSKCLSSLIDLDSGACLDNTLSERKRAALRAWRKDYLKAVKLPASFVKRFTRTTALATHEWIRAKEQDDFKIFLPHLEKIVALCRKKSEILGFKEHPYDALLDLYEPEMTTAFLTPLFASLKQGLTTLFKSIQEKPRPPSDFLHCPFPPEKQMAFGKKLLEAMGFDAHTSRLDLSSHPFCMGIHPKDTRMTTRIHPSFPLSNLFSVLHEGGHGLYNQGLPEEEFGSPLGEPVSLGIDESQSRLWETRIGRSYPFWQFHFPALQALFPEQLQAVSLESFYAAINTVMPTFIRVEADEVTYSLHVILRFEIEKALIEGSVHVKEVPELWRAKMQESLGITPTTAARGCLQDIHWSMGGFGYFPTYTLGNLYASQFFATFEKKYPDWEEKVASGDVAFLRLWLVENIHRYGRQYSPEELVLRVTHEKLDQKYFLHYLNHKYKKIYNL